MLHRSDVRSALLSLLLTLGVATAQVEQYVDVGGARVSFTCDGPKTPITVVLVGGPVIGDAASGHADNASDDPAFQAGLFSDLAVFTRTCAFVPRGLGASDPLPRVVDARTHAQDLHRVLTASQLRTPVVLVTFGFASQVARLYTAANPSRVAGLVLVDPWHETTAAALATFFKTTPRPRDADLPPEPLRWLNGWRAYVTTYVAGRAAPLGRWDVRAGDGAVRAVKPFGRLPMVVVTSMDNPVTASALSRAGTAYGRTLVGVVRAQQAKLLQMSSNSRQLTFDPADPHGTALTEGEVVVNAVRAVQDAAQRHSALPANITSR